MFHPLDVFGTTTIQVASQGRDAYGAIVTSDYKSIPGVYVSQKTQVVRNSHGESETSDASVYARLNTRINVGDIVKLPDGKTFTVIASETHTVPNVPTIPAWVVFRLGFSNLAR